MNSRYNRSQKSPYDYPDMLNFERLAGRQLRSQDNAWSIAKVLYLLLFILIIYSIQCGDIKLSAISEFLSYIR